MFRALKQASLATRLAAGVFLPLALALAAALMAWSGFDRARGEIDQAQHLALPTLKAVYAVQSELQATGLLEAQWLAARNDEQRNEVATRWRAQGLRLLQRVKQHDTLDAADAQHAALLVQDMEAVLAARNQVLLSGNAPGQRDRALVVSRQTQEAAQQSITAWRLHAEQAIDELAGRANDALSLRDVSTACLVIGAIGLALLSWHQMVHSLRWPLAQSTAAVKALSTGRVDFQLSAVGAPEFTQLIGHIDALREVIAFACDDEAEDELVSDAQRLAITERAWEQFKTAPKPAATTLPSGFQPGGAALTPVHSVTGRVPAAANDAMALPA
jgi:hypothetical protein